MNCALCDKPLRKGHRTLQVMGDMLTFHAKCAGAIERDPMYKYVNIMYTMYAALEVIRWLSENPNLSQEFRDSLRVVIPHPPDPTDPTDT